MSQLSPPHAWMCVPCRAVQLGGGEREGRVLSPLVSSRHFGLSHGIGRSGDLTAQQPKAIGSSLLQLLTTALTQHALQLAGLPSATHCLLTPVATGMTLTLALLALRAEREAAGEWECGAAQPRYVVLPRIDQKTCIKSITAAGLRPSIVQLAVASPSDALITDVAAVEARIGELGGADNVLCVLSVTSCFAPRAPDDVVGLAVLCERLAVPHIVNNAYGVQSRRVMESIERAARVGRVDAVVQSMDKNFMVPVGGAIVCEVTSGPQRHSARNSQLPTPHPASPSSAPTSASAVASPAVPRPRVSVVSSMCRLYPGRGSSSSLTDLLITLLSMGESGWLAILSRRTELFERLSGKLRQLAERHGERVLHTAGSNDISIALTVTAPPAATADTADTGTDTAADRSLSLLGSMLYRRGVSGMRVWQPGQTAPFTQLPLDGWGGHGWHADTASTSTRSSRSGYVSMACAIGMEQAEVDAVIDKLDTTLSQWRKKGRRTTQPASVAVIAEQTAESGVDDAAVT